MSFRHLPLVGASLLTACASTPAPSPTNTPAEPPTANSQPAAEPQQEFTGAWYGAIDAGAMVIDIDVELQRTGGVYAGTWGVPQQGLANHPLSKVQVEGNRITFESTLPTGQVVAFEGKLGDHELEGTYRQGGATLPFTLERGERPAKQYAQSNEHFTEQDVSFGHGEIRLAGTLTLPKSVENPPVAVLVTGSGPQDRNEEVFGFRVFEALAHELATRGIATLRYDDRGIGQSTGSFKDATTMNFADDAQSAVAYLKTRSDIDADRIGIIGHSEGAIVAPIVASRTDDVAFVVLLAPPVQRFTDLITEQIALIGRGEGLPEEKIVEQQRSQAKQMKLVGTNADADTLRSELAKVCEPCRDNPQAMEAAIMQIQSPWLQFLVGYDPAGTLAKVDVPILALIGNLDRQVPPERNLQLLRKATKRNRKVTAEQLDGVNHVLQTAQTGAFSEYAKLPKTLDPRIAPRIAEWIAGVGGS